MLLSGWNIIFFGLLYNYLEGATIRDDLVIPAVPDRESLVIEDEKVASATPEQVKLQAQGDAPNGVHAGAGASRAPPPLSTQNQCWHVLRKSFGNPCILAMFLGIFLALIPGIQAYVFSGEPSVLRPLHALWGFRMYGGSKMFEKTSL